MRSVRSIEKAEVEDIYRRGYWDAVNGDELPAGIDYCVFDFAVNSGPGKAVRELQRAVSVAPDGKVGNMTLQAVRAAADKDEAKLINAICTERLRFLESLSTFKTFGKGWHRRVAEVERLAVDMAAGDLDFPVQKSKLPAQVGSEPGETKAPPKASVVDVAPSKTPEGKGSLIAAGTGAAVTLEATTKVVSKGVDVIAPKAAEDGFIGTAAVVILALIMLAGLAVVLYQFHRRREEQKGNKLPPTLLGYAAGLFG